MTPQDMDALITVTISVGIFVCAINAVVMYYLLKWYHNSLLMPALKMVASHQPSLRVVPEEKKAERPPMRIGPAKPKELDDEKLNDLYDKLHGTL